MSIVPDRYAFVTPSGMVNGMDTDSAALIGYVLDAIEWFCCAQTFELMANGMIIDAVAVNNNTKGIDLDLILAIVIIDCEPWDLCKH